MSERTPEDRLDALAMLAAGLCEDAQVTLELYEEQQWGWDPYARVVSVPVHTLQSDEGLDYCMGVICREVGHYMIGRHHLFWLEFPSRFAGRVLMTALEQARVEQWIVSRYPGTAEWLELSRSQPEGITEDMPYFLQFCLACAYEHSWSGWEPQNELPELVAQALEDTREAREFLSDIVPPFELEAIDDPEIDEIYRTQVLPSLIRPRLLPSKWERTVQWSSLRAHRIAEDYVIPWATELLIRDFELLERYMAESESRIQYARDLLRNHYDVREFVIEALTAPEVDDEVALPFWLQFTSQRLLERYLGDRPRLQGLIRPLERRSLWGRLPRLDPLNFQWSQVTDYDTSYAQVSDQVEELTRRLGDILRPQRRMGARAGYPSGRRVDLRKLMTFEADARRYNELWVRNTIPDRRNAAIYLLIDLSGSMDGTKANAALLGTILLAETLHRLDVDFSITGFQDVLVPLCDFHQSFDDAARDRIAEMTQEISGCRTDGNNNPEYNDDGPCLLEAAEELLSHPSTERILIVISDGLPEGRRSSTEDLNEAVRTLRANDELSLVGLGLGPQTGHVRDYYPDSVANIPTEKFTDEIVQLIERLVL